MSRTIVVKGWGKASANPDYVTLSMNLEAMHMDYEEAVNMANQKLAQLQKGIVEVGFLEEDLKTTNYNVRTQYENERTENGEYQRVFKGYVCTHSVKLAFDFDSKRLNQALCTIASVSATPDLSIQFTLKDSSSIQEMVLEQAVTNATQKAQLLCKSANVGLGELKKMEYDLPNNAFVSNTHLSIDPTCMKRVAVSQSVAVVSVIPDVIEVSDSVTMEWEID